MQQTISLKVTPSESEQHAVLIEILAAHLGKPASHITGFHLLKKSLDARGKQPWILLQLLVFINEPFEERKVPSLQFKELSPSAKPVIVVGAGPAGLFAALRLIESGIRPIVVERGKEVRARRRDLANMNKEGLVNPESNYCFGEGGAGTYSDGKLYTRSNKRGDIQRILNILVQFGADSRILYEAHPHIGTNKLPHIIVAIRQAIVAAGGLVLFETRMDDLLIQEGSVKGIVTQQGQELLGEAVILATGHSARDVFELLHRKKIQIDAKPFALGVRVEHPQSLIDSVQYHCPVRDHYLPPASYSLVHQVNGRGVFSFCMCPGGIIAPAATAPGEIVVNGWSPSKRNNPYANSGMVVSIDAPDYAKMFASQGSLAALAFQQEVERKAYAWGGGGLQAPAQRLTDFVEGKFSNSLPDCSYLPGITSAPLEKVLPGFVHSTLVDGFKAFGKKMRGYYTSEAVVVATESRTSSPVRVPRDPDKLEHPGLKGLYPCGEGAGYAGGIVSAAMDGERVAAVIAATRMATW